MIMAFIIVPQRYVDHDNNDDDYNDGDYDQHMMLQ